MNDHSRARLTGQMIENLPSFMPGEPDHDAQALLDKIALQSRRIEALERILGNVESAGGASDVVHLQPTLRAPGKRSGKVTRSTFRAPPWWPVAAEPDYALEPPPGSQCFHLKGTATKVIAFAMFGLDGLELAREVARVARQQLQQGNFTPVFLTDARDHEAFRRHRYVFEYFPDRVKSAVDLDSVQQRLDLIEAKWGVDLFINLGTPRGAWVRRNSRPLEERYVLAKQKMLDGHYAQAKRIMEGFTGALNAAARFETFGRAIKSPEASIVVVSHRDHAGVEKGLASIAPQVRGRDIEVILVDNGNGRLRDYGKTLFRSFGIAEPGFNAGCSAARNVGAHFARAPHVIFLDDDGITGEGCVDALLRAMEETRAVAIRGRVLPLTSPELTGTHYDLGPARVPALSTTEGVSIWNRAAYVAAGGFDPLLAGHEGAELCSKLWRFHGPMGFMYEPGALLYHDYAPDGSASAAKQLRYKANIGYLDSLGLRWKDINAGQLRFVSDPILGYLATRKPVAPAKAVRRSVSIITTAKNGTPFLAEFTQSLKQQTHRDFELIFVDDHSQDGTAEAMKALWPNDSRLTIHTNEGAGRGAALNTALRHARGDLCLIADVDDLSIPERIEMTRNYFASNPQADCMSFVAFNESNPFRLGPPRSVFVDDVSVRELFGMPVSFPSFAFVREKFPHAFDETLKGGIDCDWVFRRSAVSPLKGNIVFCPAVYYREHEGQITATRKDTQLAVRRAAIASAYEKVLGPLSDADRDNIIILTETKQAPSSQKAAIMRWIAHFLSCNRSRHAYDPALLDQSLFEGLRDVKFVAG